MAFLIDLGSSFVAFLGHFALCVWLFNRLHALPWRRFIIKWLGRGILCFGAGLMVVYGLRGLVSGVCVWNGAALSAEDAPWLAYPALCGIVALLAIPKWLIPKLTAAVPPSLLSNDTVIVDLAKELGRLPFEPGKRGPLSRIPGNQIFQIAVQQKTLRLPRLPEKLDGLTIAHLSDLHMTGKLSRDFYDALVNHTNRLQPELVVITGDIAEKECCLDWIVPVLSRLQAREGKYFILGNHEMKLPNVSILRQRMEEAGFVDAGGKAMPISLRGVNLLLAGSEYPWFGTNPAMTPDTRFLTPDAFGLFLSHSPDQLPWAKAHGFDLMLAGHTHGGQIRIPGIGALISPSKFGFRYAGGTYFEEPTLLHVSRGVCGDHLLRLNCPPELPLLRLVRETGS